jgi:hypothetical protein
MNTNQSENHNMLLAIPVIILILLAVRYFAGWILLTIIFVPFLFIGNHLSLSEYDTQAKELDARQDAKRNLEKELAKQALEEPAFRKTVQTIKDDNQLISLEEDGIDEHYRF